jgi:predicted peroxiredoxin
MAKISKDVLVKIIEEGFFDEWKTLKDVMKRLAQKGFKIKADKRGLAAQLLTLLCQDNILEREELPKEKWEEEMGQWKYIKVK